LLDQLFQRQGVALAGRVQLCPLSFAGLFQDGPVLLFSTTKEGGDFVEVKPGDALGGVGRLLLSFGHGGGWHGHSGTAEVDGCQNWVPRGAEQGLGFVSGRWR
jgi:hypothetical protein